MPKEVWIRASKLDAHEKNNIICVVNYEGEGPYGEGAFTVPTTGHKHWGQFPFLPGDWALIALEDL